MIKIIEIIIKDTLTDIITYIVPSSIFGILSIIVVYSMEYLGVEELLIGLKKRILASKTYKWKILFFIYIYFVIDKTLLSRSLGANNSLELALNIPNILKFDKAQENMEAIENFIFFVPYTFLF